MDPRDRRVRAHGRRLRLRQEQVQPRHAGLAPAGLELQALHLLGSAREGLHAGDRDQRRAALLRRRHDRQPALGAEELRRQVRRPDDAAPRPGEVEEHGLDPHPASRSAPPYAQHWITRFGFDADKHPAYLPMALGAGSVTPMQMATAYCVFANGGYRVNPLPDQPHHRPARATCINEAQRAAAQRVGAHDRRAQRLHHDQPAAGGHAHRAPRPRRRRRSSAPTSTARPEPPTTRIDAWFAGCQQNVVAVVWMGYDDAAQARRPRDRRRPRAAGLDRLHADDAEGRAGAGADARPKASSTSAASGTTRSTRAAPA